MIVGSSSSRQHPCSKQEEKKERRYLEHMESFELYTPGLLLEQDHHELEVVRVPDILDHDPSVAAIQQQLS